MLTSLGNTIFLAAISRVKERKREIKCTKEHNPSLKNKTEPPPQNIYFINVWVPKNMCFINVWVQQRAKKTQFYQSLNKIPSKLSLNIFSQWIQYLLDKRVI